MTFSLLLMLSVCAFALDDDPSAQDERHSASFRFDLIRIPIWVTDARGMPKHGLKKRDFRLFVDGKRVPIDRFTATKDKPMELVFLLDASGSMGLGDKLRISTDTISYLLPKLKAEDQWKAVAFSDGEIVQVADKNTAHHWPERAGKLRGYGQTALFDALAILNEYFEQDAYINRAVVLFTDGNDNTSALSQDQLIQVLQILEVPVFVVAVADAYPYHQNDEDLRLHTLREIAKVSGGDVFLVRGKEALANFRRSLERQLRPQYMISMTVERGPGEQRHSLEVRLPRRPRLEVRGRTGYLGAYPGHGRR